MYSGAPYIEAIALDWNSRSSLAWFSVRDLMRLFSSMRDVISET